MQVSRIFKHFRDHFGPTSVLFCIKETNSRTFMGRNVQIRGRLALAMNVANARQLSKMRTKYETDVIILLVPTDH